MFRSLSRVIAYSLLLASFINPAIAAFDPATELKVIAADGASGASLGISVSIDGTRMAVGAAGDGRTGAVYIYDFDGNSWNQITKLVASDGAGGDRFGQSVSLSGSRLAVGSWGSDIGGNNNQGSVYVFSLSGGIWNQTTKLTASDGMANDLFGYSVSLSDSRLAVGGPIDDSSQGSAYVFDLVGGTWAQTTKLTASDGAGGDGFGGSVSLSGSRLAVGANGDDIDSNSNQGSAYVFNLSGGTWSEATKLTASDGAANDFFGVSISLSGNRLAVGTYGDDSDQGSAYVFDFNGSIWSQTAKLVASDGTFGDRFGRSTSLSGNRLVVGGNGDDGYKGAAYVFDLSGGIWNQTTKLTASDGVANDSFGRSVSLSDSRLAVGANGNDSLRGAAYVYTAASRATAVPVPTTNAYGILLMLLAMLGVAWFGVRRS